MPMISDNQILEIRNQADIVDIVGQYLPLVRRGKSYWAICPFHDDHDPSMSVSAEKQIYKCFVCGAGGNVFTFVQNYEKLSFVDAVAKVASTIGVHLDISSHTKEEVDPHTRQLQKLMREAVNYTKYQLQSADGVDAKEIVLRRGITEAQIEKFEIGFNPGSGGLSQFLLAKGYELPLTMEANVTSGTLDYYRDVFAFRITFPLYDLQGHPVAFSARAIQADEQAKYINTTETPLFVKGNLLYNYHRAKQPAKKEGFVIVCEGVTDVIAYDRIGVDHVVATLGTAFTPKQVELLRKMHYHIVIAYDGDAAGKRATYQLGKALLEQNCLVEVIQYPGTLDPDDVIATYGIASLKQCVESRLPLMEFVLQYGTTLYQLDNFNQKKQYILAMVEQIRKFEDPLEARHFTNRLADITQMPFDDLFAMVAKKVGTKPQRRIVNTSDPLSSMNRYECEILAQMMLSKEVAKQFTDQLGFLITPVAQRLSMLILDHYRQFDQFIIADVLARNLQPAISETLLALSDWALFPKQVNAMALNDAFNHVKIRLIEDRIATYRKTSSQLVDPIEKANYANKIIECKREIALLNQITKEEDNGNY